jgi:hypothetical protein
MLAFACFAVAMVVFVLAPVRYGREADVAGADRLLDLIATRDRTLDELRELEFDHRSGNVTDAEYGGLVGDLRRRAAAALHAVEGAEAQLSSSGTPR